MPRHYCGLDTPKKVGPVIQKPLAATNGEGFFISCPRCVLDIKPHGFFNDRGSSPNSGFGLPLVDSFHKVGR